MYQFILDGMRSIPDFPKPGVVFKDITPLLEDGESFRKILHLMVEKVSEFSFNGKIDKIMGIESRGFIFAAPLADRLGCGLVLARKPGKLPYKTVKQSFKLEYGEDSLEIHVDSIKPGERVLIVDDVLATGGTMQAAGKLVEQLGGDVVGILFLQELTFLNGKERLKSESGEHWSYRSLVS